MTSRSLLAASLAACLLALPARADDEPKPPPMKGVCLVLRDPNPKIDYPAQVRDLAKHGVNHVLLIVHFFQPNANSPAPARHPLHTVSDPVVLRTMKTARKLKLEVTLLPTLLLIERGPDDWRGNIRPPDHRGRIPKHAEYAGPSWSRWFAGYGRVIEHYARLAQEGGASMFGVGSELSSTERQLTHWNRLIAKVRRVFPGELIYSANWDHYEHVGYWRSLDYIGLSGYYELTESREPRQAELNAAWLRVRERLLGWRARQRLDKTPFVFLELGYASIDGCAKYPWDYTQKTKIDLAEQRDCYRAFVHAWNGRPELGGVFFYEWGPGGPLDRGYTPRGKPALEVMRRYFKAR